jgi:hypothetical protein
MSGAPVHWYSAARLEFSAEVSLSETDLVKYEPRPKS